MALAQDREAARISDGPLRILHVMRAPVGGLFRHVVDLARAQTRDGHLVGVVADSTTGDDATLRLFDSLSADLALGVARWPMRRLPHPHDLRVAWRVARLTQELGPDVLHGHGAKGGLYARLPALLPVLWRSPRPVARVYAPHGGSLHFEPDTPTGRLFFAVERRLARVTDFFPFESDFSRRRFESLVETPRALAQVIRNGLAPEDFAPVTPRPEAADFVFIGEMRAAKGVEDLLRAFALLSPHLRLALVGSGSEAAAFRALASTLGVDARVTFFPSMQTREAFRLGHVLVAPSRAESLPYIVLEAIAARRPLVASAVGDVPHILRLTPQRLAPPRDPPALARAMQAAIEMAPPARGALADRLADDIRRRFSIDRMSADILSGYRAALARRGAGFTGTRT